MQFTVYLRVVSALHSIPNEEYKYKWHVTPLPTHPSYQLTLVKTDYSHPSYQLTLVRKVFVKKCWQAAFFYSSQL